MIMFLATVLWFRSHGVVFPPIQIDYPGAPEATVAHGEQGDIPVDPNPISLPPH